MDISVLVGLLFGFGALIAGFLLEKGVMASLFLLSPAIIVFGGTIGAVFVSFPMKEVVKVPKLVSEAFRGLRFTNQEVINVIVSLCEKVKRQGLLILENEVDAIDKDMDPMVTKAMLLVTDGKNTEELREILENEIHLYGQRKQIEASIFDAAGGYSPTMGIIGTVMGLVQVLSNISDPAELAKSIAVAFIATLYGVCFANLIYLPLGNKIKVIMKYTKIQKELIMEGFCAITDGASATILKDRLSEYAQMDGAEKTNKSAAKKETGKEIIKEVNEEKGA